VALLELSEVTAGYGQTRVLHGITAHVEAGTIVALLGANGAGKTTTLRAISGMVWTGGQIIFDGRPLINRRPEDVARLGIAHVPEGRGTLSQLTVLQNLHMGAYVRRDRQGVRSDLDRVIGYFPWLGERLHQVSALLSGGEQQMLAIARALMLRPRMLLLDEPSLGLGPIVVSEMFRMVEAINRDEQLTVLIVEQNANLALKVASHAYVLEVGRVVLEGRGDELSRHESVRRSYLGY
jgi:branched-chain amino acid transport system ATP-binding protein